MPTNHTAPTCPLGLPLVLQLGFAGSRALLDRKEHPSIDVSVFEEQVQQQLVELLSKMPKELGLSNRHFICGVSALAIGADTVFTRACRTLNWPQRLMLPQQREDFLQAVGSDGKPDFTETERSVARELFASPHIIQQRVVSESPDRHTRFHDVNLELVNACDVIVCLTRAAADSKPGGTHEVAENGRLRGRTLLEISVSVTPDGKPTLQSTWHNRETFAAPALPVELCKLQTDLTCMPSLDDYCRALKGFASRQSQTKQKLFKTGALVVIGTHVLATTCAVIALMMHGTAALPWVLGGELLLLALGFATHQYLHLSHASGVWAMARLVAEVARSCAALRQVPGQLSHLSTVPMPTSLRPLLRTLNVLHLRETREAVPGHWSERSKAYVEARLTNPKGQIPYYKDKLDSAQMWQKFAYSTFVFGSVCAFIATLSKLLLIWDQLPVPHEAHDAWAAGLGSLAVLLPILAVAALSLAASSDLEARCHTYAEMLKFLRAQERQLTQASSERAFSTLALETETQLLGENAAWYYRRAFTGVT